jgi:Pentapeptide repeats (8 copies)
MKGNSLHRLIAALFVTLATTGAIVAYIAASASASASGGTINGSFCMPIVNGTMNMRCIEATFDGQTAEGYTNHPAALTLTPGTYTFSVLDDSAGHDFSLRSCPGTFTACGPGSGTVLSPPLTTRAENDTSPVTRDVELTAGTYRLFCDVGAGTANAHESAGMYVDIVVAALRGANLHGANLENALLPNVDLHGANLQGADGSNGNFSGAGLQGANLSRGTFDNADFSGADLQGANLNRADLTGADLSGANLAGANLNSANLTGANLDGADVAGANLNTVTYSNTTCPDGTNSDADGGTCKGHL